MKRHVRASVTRLHAELNGCQQAGRSTLWDPIATSVVKKLAVLSERFEISPYIQSLCQLICAAEANRVQEHQISGPVNVGLVDFEDMQLMGGGQLYINEKVFFLAIQP